MKTLSRNKNIFSKRSFYIAISLCLLGFNAPSTMAAPVLAVMSEDWRVALPAELPAPGVEVATNNTADINNGRNY